MTMVIDHRRWQTSRTHGSRSPIGGRLSDWPTGCGAEGWRGKAVPGEKQRISDLGGSMPEGATSFFVRLL